MLISTPDEYLKTDTKPAKAGRVDNLKNKHKGRNAGMSKTYKSINLIIVDGKIVAMDIENNSFNRIEYLAEWEEDSMTVDEVLDSIKLDLNR